MPKNEGPTGVIQIPPAQEANSMMKKIDTIFFQDLCFFPETAKTVVKKRAMIRAMRNSPNIMEHSFLGWISFDLWGYYHY